VSQADIAPELRKLVRERALERCEYCCIPEQACFSTLEVDQIIAEQHAFSLEADGRFIGKTSIGRATLQLLALNDERRRQERQTLMAADAWHPPST
jgi:hypothetical protein